MAWSKPLIFMQFHGVSLGDQHEIWSKQHNAKVRPDPLSLSTVYIDYSELKGKSIVRIFEGVRARVQILMGGYPPWRWGGWHTCMQTTMLCVVG